MRTPLLATLVLLATASANPRAAVAANPTRNPIVRAGRFLGQLHAKTMDLTVRKYAPGGGLGLAVAQGIAGGFTVALSAQAFAQHHPVGGALLTLASIFNWGTNPLLTRTGWARDNLAAPRPGILPKVARLLTHIAGLEIDAVVLATAGPTIAVKNVVRRLHRQPTVSLSAELGLTK
ncbi:MAG: hypothetical protein IT371_27245 [Deltaproteobacteria bacterium]|nr:hypothetical protein [Deltaproteobacteria bacterium]